MEVISIVMSSSEAKVRTIAKALAAGRPLTARQYRELLSIGRDEALKTMEPGVTNSPSPPCELWRGFAASAEAAANR